MSRTGRLLVVAAAWAIPVAWIAVALLSGPSDGTAVSSIGLNEDQRWGRSVTVLETYGDTPLHEGDTILRVDRRSMSDWLDGEATGTRSEGEAPLYEILRPGAGIDQNLEVEAPLGRYPWSDAVAENVSTLSVVVVLLTGASFVFWRRPTDVAVLWFLAAAVLVPAALTSWPFGLDAADLAGSRGVWPQVVGEAAFCAGLGALLVAALAIGTPPGWFRRRPWVAPALVAVPFAGYALWVFTVASGLDSAPGRLDAFTTLAAPGGGGRPCPRSCCCSQRSTLRIERAEDRAAARLTLLAIAAGIAVRLLLVDVPSRIDDTPADHVGGPRTPSGGGRGGLLGGRAAALPDRRHRAGRYAAPWSRPSSRPWWGVFSSLVAGAVTWASETSFEAMVAGGVVALLLLPVAVGLQRAVRRLVYGDRAFPGRVVSDLRHSTH